MAKTRSRLKKILRFIWLFSSFGFIKKVDELRRMLGFDSFRDPPYEELPFGKY
jgi:hypothetical protein